MSTRSEINQALAKALAYADCGKFDEAQRWGEILIRKLELAAVFKVGTIHTPKPFNSYGRVNPEPITWAELQKR